MLNLLLRSAIFGGILTGLVCGILLVVAKLVGLHPFEQHRFIFLPIYFIGLVLTLRFFAQKSGQRILQHWQSLSMGFVFNATLPLIYAIFIGTILTFLPEWVKEHQELLLQKAQTDLQRADTADKALFEGILQNIQTVSAADIASDIWIKTSLVGVVLVMGIGIGFRKF